VPTSVRPGILVPSFMPRSAGSCASLEHLHAARRGQRDPQIAVDRPNLPRRGQMKRQLAVF